MEGVTEVAFIQLSADHNTEELKEVLEKTQQVQTQWILRHQPQLLEGKPYSHTTDIWISEDDSPRLLLTAPWESVDAHNEWIQSQENTSLMQELKKFIRQDQDSILLYHWTPVKGTNGFRGDTFAQGPVKIWKISVKPEEKAKLEKAFHAVETQSSTETSQMMWAGWKVEEEGRENMVILASPSCEELIESGIASKLEDTRVSRFEHKPLMH